MQKKSVLRIAVAAAFVAALAAPSAAVFAQTPGGVNTNADPSRIQANSNKITEEQKQLIEQCRTAARAAADKFKTDNAAAATLLREQQAKARSERWTLVTDADKKFVEDAKAARITYQEQAKKANEVYQAELAAAKTAFDAAVNAAGDDRDKLNEARTAYAAARKAAAEKRTAALNSLRDSYRTTYGNSLQERRDVYKKSIEDMKAKYESAKQQAQGLRDQAKTARDNFLTANPQCASLRQGNRTLQITPTAINGRVVQN